jgi:hypothetical protein
MEDERLNELVEYTRRDLAARSGGPATGGEVHIHYHAPAPVEAKRSPGQDTLDRYVPYFFVLLGGMVILGGVAVIAVMLAPVLLAILGSVVALVIAAAAAVGAVAVLMVGGSAAIKALRETPEPAKKGRRRR